MSRPATATRRSPRPAASRDVTSTDYVPELLEQGRRRAEADGLPMTFQVADAEQLPFEDGVVRRRAVDVRGDVRALPGARRGRAAPGRAAGRRIGLANWTPDGFLGRPVPGHGPLRAATGRAALTHGVGLARRGSLELFGPPRPTSAPSEAARSTSATSPPTTGSTSSGPSTARRTRRSPRSIRSGSSNSTGRSAELLQQWNANEPGPLVVPGEYLEAVIHQAPDRQGPSRPARSSVTRVRTTRVTTSSGMGRSAGNRMVPLPARYGAMSAPSVSTTTALAGNRL